jgi:hypothetical protein
MTNKTNEKALSPRTLATGLALGAAALGLAWFLSACRTTAPAAGPRAVPAASAKPVSEEVKSHVDTGFPLEGRHAELACEACHGGKEDPKPSCKSCHKAPHEPGLKRECETCHTAGHPFREVKFKHPNKGLFAAHKGADCLACHPGRQFLSAKKACASCHTDFHKGSQGRDCAVCHKGGEWGNIRFSHNGTGFPLMGAHRALECGDCHRDLQSFRITPRPSSCAACHDADYRSSPFPHAAYGAGRDCQECHLQDSWSYAHSPFWFNIQTGSMAGIDCASCHQTPGNYREYTCHDCHKGHTGDRNGRCLDCHPGGFPGGVAAPADRRSK